MPKSMRNARKLIVSMLIIDMMRTTVEVFLREKDISRHADDALLCCAMFVGQAEGKPMTAGKIADYIGMPRPSAVRKLQALEARGVVEQVSVGKWRLAVSAPEIDARISESERAQWNNVRRAAAKMSKLDSMAIERQKSDA